MTRTLSLTITVLLLLSMLVVPTMVGVTAQTTPTTTMPTTTTSTTWVLTGPGGIHPDYTSTLPWTTTTTTWDCISTPPPTVTTTTEPPTPTNGNVNLLAWAEIDEDDTVSVLSYPSDNFDLCADCYTNDGAQLTVRPLENGPWDTSIMRYLHMTVRTNMPFRVMLNGTYASRSWFAAAAGTEETLPAGGYRIVIDLYDRYTQSSSAYPSLHGISSLSFELLAAGSISVGHIALSDTNVCDEPIPNIQTTTKPSFPWDSTTTAPSTTTTTTTTWGFTTTTTLILTGPDGTTNSTLPTTTTTEDIGCESTPPPMTTTSETWPHTTIATTTTTSAPVYTSGKPISSTRPTYGTTIAPDGLIHGDMNCDFTIDMIDAFALYTAVSSGDFSGIAILRLADVNGDGIYDMVDAFHVYRQASGAA